MERYKLRLSYEGSGFAGSQRQSRRRTVQAELEKALRPLGWTGRSVILAGRTDAGVHALGQVAAFDLQWNHGRDELRDALNATLPSDMAVLSVDLVDSSFHPRFDASARRYRYRAAHVESVAGGPRG
jgi:tRNA pseudouridine38-40 synthase